MDESWLYPGTIVVLLILAYMMWQMNAKKMVLLILLVLAYIVYSHETGHTISEYSEEVGKSFDKAVGN